MQIRKVAVLGAGVMGSGIAAHLAKAGVQVELLDLKLEWSQGALKKALKVMVNLTWTCLTSDLPQKDFQEFQFC